MKTELGYHLEETFINEDEFKDDCYRKVPIYGLRAIPQEIIDRQWGNPNFGKHHWQVEIWYAPTAEYVWINQIRSRVFLH